MSSGGESRGQKFSGTKRIRGTSYPAWPSFARQVFGWSMRARRLFCQVAVGRMGYPGAEVARFLGVTTSAVVRAAHSESHLEIEKYL